MNLLVQAAESLSSASDHLLKEQEEQDKEHGDAHRHVGQQEGIHPASTDRILGGAACLAERPHDADHCQKRDADGEREISPGREDLGPSERRQDDGEQNRDDRRPDEQDQGAGLGQKCNCHSHTSPSRQEFTHAGRVTGQHEPWITGAGSA